MIVVEEVSKSFGPLRVLEGLSLTVPDGGTTVLMGANGSGKTTLLKLVLGLLTPDAGSIRGVEGRRRSAVFQEDRLVEHVTAVANVRLVMPHRVENSTICGELARAGLPDEAMVRPVIQLSGGQRRRVAIVRAMMAEADIVCLDEPFEGLDAATRPAMLDYVLERTSGRDVLLITHDAAEAARFGGNVVQLVGQ